MSVSREHSMQVWLFDGAGGVREHARGTGAGAPTLPLLDEPLAGRAAAPVVAGAG